MRSSLTRVGRSRCGCPSERRRQRVAVVERRVPHGGHARRGRSAVTRRLVPGVEQLTSSLAAAATRFADVVKAGRTHMMDAVPVFLGDEFAGYAAQLDEARERIESRLGRIGRVPLGGTAVGNGLNAPPSSVPMLLPGWRRRSSRALDCTEPLRRSGVARLDRRAVEPPPDLGCCADQGRQRHPSDGFRPGNGHW